MKRTDNLFAAVRLCVPFLEMPEQIQVVYLHSSISFWLVQLTFQEKASSSTVLSFLFVEYYRKHERERKKHA